MATFSFSIKDQGKSLADLKKQIDKKTSALITSCKKLGVDTKKISSAEITIRPQYNYQTKAFLGYDVSRNVKVILNDLDRYTELVNSAIEAGITTIGNINLDVEDKNKLQRKALGAAITDAKRKAEIMAANGGVYLVRAEGTKVLQKIFIIK